MYKAILVGADRTNNGTIDYEMEELHNLAVASELDVVYTVTQSIARITPNLYIGSGKVDEIKNHVIQQGADIVVFNNELSGSQLRNLEQILDCRVIDRTLLILDIFAKRAKTKEAMLQVEIAQLAYLLPRLVGMRDSLNRQQGGIGSRGPGEKKLELDRRRIVHERSRLEQELKDIVKQRQIQRRTRQRSNIRNVAIVGYTNAGKSTLLNALVEATSEAEHKKVFVKNMLFATLETATRHIVLDNNKEFLATDTVGFVSNLPHKLVEAFQSTLEEITEADLILHVVDASNPFHETQIDVTNDTLSDIGVHDIPMLYLYNKIDLIEEPLHPMHFPNIELSIHNKEAIPQVLDAIEAKLFHDYETVKLLIPFEEGELVAYLNQNNHILSQEYVNEGTIVELELSPLQKRRYAAYLL